VDLPEVVPRNTAGTLCETQNKPVPWPARAGAFRNTGSRNTSGAGPVSLVVTARRGAPTCDLVALGFLRGAVNVRDHDRCCYPGPGGPGRNDALRCTDAGYRRHAPRGVVRGGGSCRVSIDSRGRVVSDPLVWDLELFVSALCGVDPLGGDARGMSRPTR